MKLTSKRPSSAFLSVNSSKPFSVGDLVDEEDQWDDDEARVASNKEDALSIISETQRSDSDDEVQQIINLSSKETSKIRFWRLVVALVIVGAGALVSTGTYLYISELERKDAEDAFVLFSNTIEDISRFHFKNMFEASRAMSREMTAAAVLERHNTNGESGNFPFVTFPNYEVYATQAREAAGLEVVSYAPVVTLEQNDAFVNYTLEHQQWISDTRRLGMQIDPSLVFDDINNTEFNPVIYDVNPLAGETFPSLGEGPFSALWHVSPPPQNLALVYMLYNFASDPEYQTIYDLQEDLRDTMFGNTNFFLGTVVDFVVGGTKHQNLHEARSEPEDGKPVNITQPHCSLVQPVFSSLEQNAPIAGYLMGIMAFDAYLIDLLPDGVRGIYVVVENTCGAKFTYRLNGNEAEWMGEGDLHEEHDNEIVRTINFDDNYHNPDTVNTPGHCVFSYQVYPSDVFVSDYSSNLPVMLSLLVAAVFFIMVVAFAVLMRFVDQRQNKVVGEAAISNAIVSSLFPSSVRKRLFADRTALLPQEATESGKSGLRSFLKGQDEEAIDNHGILKAKPIADLFPEATIMFSDIAGFTSWSSSRQPAEVFTLLETLYRAFDALAAKHKVFKVETIGDCYVAVCGLPVSNSRHALVMAKFAKACLDKMNSLLPQLSDHLGKDTQELTFRTGLHSGKVTAGVLRGERSRFQLFGDTVNTAARMESNGLPNRIHVSEATAAKLEALGKGDWCVPREEKIIAKGKGELQTYWLQFPENALISEQALPKKPLEQSRTNEITTAESFSNESEAFSISDVETQVYI